MTIIFLNYNSTENVSQHSRNTYVIVVYAVLMAFLNTRTVDVSGRVTVCFTLAKVAALTVIIVGGIIVIGKGMLSKT